MNFKLKRKHFPFWNRYIYIRCNFKIFKSNSKAHDLGKQKKKASDKKQCAKRQTKKRIV